MLAAVTLLRITIIYSAKGLQTYPTVPPSHGENETLLQLLSYPED